ncbi:MAG: hypothetical protein FJY83_01480 [Candidatus Aminicenantes bacterium]|nr:hypothetical protein [Candidatus Aminicenantes bacterium]
MRPLLSVLLAALALGAPLSAAGDEAVGPALSAGRSSPERGAAPGEKPSGSPDDAPARPSTLQKSLLIPGWGQAAEKRYLEAVLFFSAEVVCWAGFFDQNARGNRAYDLYRAADTTDDAVRYRRETERFDKRRNLFLLGAALVWTANLLDAWLIVSGRGEEKDGERRSLSLRLDCGEGHKIALALACRF